MDVKSLTGGSGCLCCDCAAGLACFTVLREWKISYALTWSTCLCQKRSSVTCGWGVLPQKGCHTAASARSFSVGLGLIWLYWSQQGWFSLNADPEFPREQGMAGMHQHEPVQLGAVLRQTYVLPFMFSLSPQVSCFLSLLPPNYKRQQSQTSNLLLPWTWWLPPVGVYVLPLLWCAGGDLPPEQCIPLPLSTWSCWCCSSGKIAVFSRLWLLSLFRQDWAVTVSVRDRRQMGCSAGWVQVGFMPQRWVHVIMESCGLLIFSSEGGKKRYVMFVLHVCACQSNNLVFCFFVALWITEYRAIQKSFRFPVGFEHWDKTTLSGSTKDFTPALGSPTASTASALISSEYQPSFGISQMKKSRHVSYKIISKSWICSCEKVRNVLCFFRVLELTRKRVTV